MLEELKLAKAISSNYTELISYYLGISNPIEVNNLVTNNHYVNIVL